MRLSRPVRPTHFSVEHLHAALCDPAERELLVGASTMEVVGRAVTARRSSSARLRRGVVGRADGATAAASLGERVDAVTLRVKSNHGHPDYTCLYRFRVHGDE